MIEMKRSLLAVVGLMAALLVPHLTLVLDATAQTSKDVVVSNPPTRPIPTVVQALPPISGTVGIGGVVSISDATSAAKQPSELLIATTLPAGQFVLVSNTCIFVDGTCIGTTVPAGKRLVVESIAAEVRVPSGQKVLVSVFVSRVTGGMTFPLPTTHQGAFFGQEVFQGAQAFRLYADPGMSVGAVVSRDLDTGNANVFVTFSGYFVDL